MKVLAATLLSLLPASALACSCGVLSPAQYYEDADFVFQGEVIDLDVAGAGCGGVSSTDPVYVRLRVSRRWKGEVGAEMEVLTYRDGASCGFGFGEARSYVVFAHKKGDDLFVGSCGGTQLSEEASAVLEALGPGEPVASAGTRGSYGWAGLLLVPLARLGRRRA